MRESWVLHATPEWSNTRLEEAQDQVLPTLLDAFWKTTRGASPSTSDLLAEITKWTDVLANADDYLQEPDGHFDDEGRVTK